MNGLLIVHCVISIALIVLVFIQYGRGGDMGASMGGGGGSANSVFGASGSADFISKLTGAVGILFFVSCLVIGAMYKRAEGLGGTSEGLMKDYVAPKPVVPAPDVPASKSDSIPVHPAAPVSTPIEAQPAPAANTQGSPAKVEGIPVQAPVVMPSSVETVPVKSPVAPKAQEPTREAAQPGVKPRDLGVPAASVLPAKADESTKKGQ